MPGEKEMMEHTKGPWVFGKTDEGKRIILGGSNGSRYVCNIQIHQMPRHMGLYDEAEREANARLIAAAPDLLEALKEIAEHLYQPSLDVGRCRDMAKAAIAKAQG